MIKPLKVKYRLEATSKLRGNNHTGIETRPPEDGSTAPLE